MAKRKGARARATAAAKRIVNSPRIVQKSDDDDGQRASGSAVVGVGKRGAVAADLDTNSLAKRSRRAITIAQQKNQRHDELMRMQTHQADISPPSPTLAQIDNDGASDNDDAGLKNLSDNTHDLASVSLSSAYIDSAGNNEEETQFIEVQDNLDALNASVDSAVTDTGPPVLSPAHEPEHIEVDDEVYEDVDENGDVGIDVDDEPNVVYHLVPTSFMDMMPSQQMTSPTYSKLSRAPDDLACEYDPALFDVVDQYLVSPGTSSGAVDQVPVSSQHEHIHTSLAHYAHQQQPSTSYHMSNMSNVAVTSRRFVPQQSSKHPEGITVTTKNRARITNVPSRIILKLEEVDGLDEELQQLPASTPVTLKNETPSLSYRRVVHRPATSSSEVDRSNQFIYHQEKNATKSPAKARLLGYGPPVVHAATHRRSDFLLPQHLGGRGHFGVSSEGIAPIPAVIERAEDYVSLPPSVAADHCYGKVPPPAGHVVYQTFTTSGPDCRLPPAHLLPTAPGSMAPPNIKRIVLSETPDSRTYVPSSASERRPNLQRRDRSMNEPMIRQFRVHNVNHHQQQQQIQQQQNQLNPHQPIIPVARLQLSRVCMPTTTSTGSGTRPFARNMSLIRRVNLIRSSVPLTSHQSTVSQPLTRPTAMSVSSNHLNRTTTVHVPSMPVNMQQQQQQQHLNATTAHQMNHNNNKITNHNIMNVTTSADNNHNGSNNVVFISRISTSDHRMDDIDIDNMKDVKRNLKTEKNDDSIATTTTMSSPSAVAATYLVASSTTRSKTVDTVPVMMTPVTIKTHSSPAVLASSAAPSPRLSSAISSPPPPPTSSTNTGTSSSTNPLNMDDDHTYEQFRMPEHGHSLRTVPVLVDQLPANILDDDEHDNENE